MIAGVTRFTTCEICFSNEWSSSIDWGTLLLFANGWTDRSARVLPSFSWPVDSTGNKAMLARTVTRKMNWLGINFSFGYSKKMGAVWFVRPWNNRSQIGHELRILYSRDIETHLFNGFCIRRSINNFSDGSSLAATLKSESEPGSQIGSFTTIAHKIHQPFDR